MCFRLVIIAIASVIFSPVAKCFLQLEAISNDVQHEESTPTPADIVSTEDDVLTENPASRQIINGSGQLGPGSLCRQQTDCAHELFCLASGMCGCSQLSPVLLLDAGSFTCVKPRRLNEPCLSHSECSHGNKHAFCLDSVCRCPSRFRTDEDRSLCLPESMMFSLVTMAILPALVLILAVVGLGVLSYQRLYKSSGDKQREAPDLPISSGDASCPSNAMTRDNFASFSRERGSRSGSISLSEWSRQRSFAMDATLGMGGVRHHCKWPISDSSSPCTMTHENELTNSTPFSLNYTCKKRQTSRMTFLESDVTSMRLSSSKSSQLGSARYGLVRPSAQGSVTTYSPSPPSTTADSDNPVPKQRTRISTLSTSTLMPCRRANRRSNFSSSESSTATTFTYRNWPGFLGSGLSGLREMDTEANSEESEKSSMLLKSSPKFTFTASELQAAGPKKFRSENLGVTNPKQIRRTVSDLHDRLSAIVEEQAEGEQCCSAGSSNVHLYAPSDDSKSTFEWRTESCMKLFSGEDFDHDKSNSVLTCSQKTWPCEPVVQKSPDRRARTCEAFTAQHGEMRLPKLVKRPKAKIAAFRRLPRMFLGSGSHRPVSRDSSRRRHQALISSMASSETQSIETCASVPDVRSVALEIQFPCGSGGPQSRKPGARARSPLSRAYQSAPHAVRMAAAGRRCVDP